jgi:Flp pilus assembly protein TadD
MLHLGRLLGMMFAIVFATSLFAQDSRRDGSPATSRGEDISKRLERVFTTSGQAQTALSALASHEYSNLERMISELEPLRPAELAELKSLEGVIAFMDGKMNAAVESFGQAAKLAPLNDADSFTLAMAYVAQGDADHARSLLADLSARHPKDAIYLYWLGRLDYYQRRYEEAVEKLKRASELDASSTRIWNSLGLAYDMQGLADEALPALTKAAQFNRKEARPSPWPPHDLGFFLLRANRFTEAEGLLREALKYDSAMPEAHLHLGRTLEAEGHGEAAVPEYEAAVKLDPASPDACYPLAMLYKKLHRDSEAEAMFAELKKRKQALPSAP